MPKPKSGKTGEFTIRLAEEKDAALILKLIREFAEYEKLADKVEATEQVLQDSLFHHKVAEALIAEQTGKPVGYAIFFHNFSSFLGRAGIFVEDIYVKPELRGSCLGKKLFAVMACLAVERGCGRLEWACLDWNAPAISFYKQLDAEPLTDWTMYRLAGKDLANLAAGG